MKSEKYERRADVTLSIQVTSVSMQCIQQSMQYGMLTDVSIKVPCGSASSNRSPNTGTSSYRRVSNVQDVVISIARPNAKVSAPATMIAKKTNATERGKIARLNQVDISYIFRRERIDNGPRLGLLR